MDGELLDLYNAGQAIVLEQRAIKKASDDRLERIKDAKVQLVADELLKYIPEQLKEYITKTEIKDESGSWNYIYIAYPDASEIRVSLWVRFKMSPAQVDVPEINEPREPVFQFRTYNYWPPSGLYQEPKIEVGWSEGFQPAELGLFFYLACEQHQRLVTIESKYQEGVKEYQALVAKHKEESAVQTESGTETVERYNTGNDIEMYTDEYGRTGIHITDQFFNRLRDCLRG